VIRVAILGAGHWGPNLIRLFDENRRASVSVVADRDADRLARVSARFSGVRTTDDALAAAVAPDVDAVVVATPTSTHFELARAALDAGKHVFVEKPIATSTADGEQLCALADAGDRVLMVGHVFLFNPGVLRVKQYLDDGALVDLHYISMERTNLGPIRPDVNAAWDLAAHDISIANFWLGAEPERVSANGSAWINPGVEDAVFATLIYPGNVLVNIHASWLHPRKSREIAVVGAERMLTFDDLNMTEPIRLYDKAVTDERREMGFVDSFASFRASVRDGDILTPKVQGGEPLGSEVEHFLACIDGAEQPRTPGRQGVAVVRALEAISRSLAAGGAPEDILVGADA
jgi:predicted dehydrogenase